MKTKALLVVAVLGVASLHAQDAPPAGFTSLFNGKDLAG